ncbi:putative cytochrome P450 [Lyophyllum shimeji]|uniref:Cytochrome P450 n=1 Tax=Lyophyllum shimeji TaxID=47721 RepID=A0A9P3PH47_LYOSH|nr:putative cytochrome P450 [Lyophyllum shimeji]
MDSMAGDEVTHATIIFPVVLVLLVAFLVRVQQRQSDLTRIPTVGPSRFPLSYIGAVQFLFHAERLLQEGYQHYKPSAFKVARFTRWIVVITGPRLVEELRKAPEDEMSYDATTDSKELTSTGIHVDIGHIAPLSTHLTRNLPLMFSEMRDEMVTAIGDAMPNVSATVSAIDASTEIFSRVCNRILVGLEVCRSPEMTVLNKQFLEGKARGKAILSALPMYLFIALRGRVNRVRSLIEPMIAQKPEDFGMFGKEYPHGILSSLIAADSSNPKASRHIADAILALNAHAIPALSLTFTHALYHLATASPSDVVQPMREEVEAAVGRGGWTPSALERMRRIDSFLKESMRVSGLHALTMLRKSRTDYTFSDGTHVPKGTILAVACAATHADPSKYPSPQTFDAFRFVQGSGQAASRYQLSTTAPDFLGWGYGRAACPGRFVAAVQMKMVLAHLVLHYDVRLEDGAGDVRPRDWWVGSERLPDLSARLMFKKRR